MRQRYAQLLRANLAEHGVYALAHVAFAGDHGGSAIFVDFEHHRRAIPVAQCAVAADMHRSGYAYPAFVNGSGQWFAFVFVVPGHGVAHLLQAFGQATAANAPAVHTGVAALGGIAQVHIDGVEPQHLRHRGEVAVERKLHLLPAKTAKRAVGWVVGIYKRGVAAHISDAVHVVAAHGGDMHHIAC